MLPRSRLAAALWPLFSSLLLLWLFNPDACFITENVTHLSHYLLSRYEPCCCHEQVVHMDSFVDCSAISELAGRADSLSNCWCSEILLPSKLQINTAIEPSRSDTQATVKAAGAPPEDHHLRPTAQAVNCDTTYLQLEPRLSSCEASLDLVVAGSHCCQKLSRTSKGNKSTDFCSFLLEQRFCFTVFSFVNRWIELKFCEHASNTLIFDLDGGDWVLMSVQ